MKKYIVLLLVFLLIGCADKTDNNVNRGSNSNITPNIPSVDEPKQTKIGTYNVEINLFHWNSCSHCQEEIEWLQYIDNKYSNVKVNYYEVEEYPELVQKVRDEFSISGSSVPLTVIGTNYYLGFGNSSKAKLMTTIEEYAEFESCNIVEKIINNEDTSSCYMINATE